MNGIAGYALNDSQNITSSSVNNPNESLIDNVSAPRCAYVGVGAFKNTNIVASIDIEKYKDDRTRIRCRY